MKLIMILYLQLMMLTFGTIASANESHAWGYEGDTAHPEEWPEVASACAGDTQSPINVDCLSSTYVDVDGPNVQVLRTDTGTLVNNGHSAQWNPGNGQVVLTTPNLKGIFKMAQVHFHWGLTPQEGSEHTLNGKRASLEMHLVFYNSIYPSFDAASKSKAAESVAVIGLFFNERPQDNVLLQPVVQGLAAIPNNGDSVKVPFMEFNKFNTSNTFEYKGSLTTPGCNEVVHWFVVPEIQPVGDDQMAAFRSIYFEDHSSMGNNYRPVQDLNGRVVTRNFANCGIAK